MTWRRRLSELLCAGGTLVSSGCHGVSGGTCNANPDPCCPVLYAGTHPELKPWCEAKQGCEQQGGEWTVPEPGATVDAGPIACVFIDAGVADAAVTDAASRD